ncbi:MAG: hypothetical protein MJ168_06170 [Clostridia bacterium]|nr:hypothetical protein [Clostridia bacterium]
MNKLSLESINIKDKSIQINFSVSGDESWTKLFIAPYTFTAEYDVDISTIPLSVAMIPFVANFLPMVWLCDAEMYIPDIDKAYYDSIPEFKKGLVNMHPKFQFGGKVIAQKITENHSEVPAEKSALFFSGGVDATNTLIAHVDERPIMITLWGADMPVDNSEGWQTIYNQVANASRVFDLELQIVKTSFKSVLNLEGLNSIVERKEFGNNWYEHFQHGIAFFGQVAPLAYKIGLKTIYIASSYSPEDVGKYICGSDPTIDNFTRFVETSVVHDSYAVNRQEKIKNICDYRKKSGIASPLRVCWKSKGGVNCCDCEKCFRTIIGIIVEGENPIDYGFPYFNDSVRQKMMYDLQKKYKIKFHSVHYKPIQAALQKKYTYKDCPDDLKWLYKTKLVTHSSEFFRAYGFASKTAHKILSAVHLDPTKK